jgi:hypothetical protein
MPAATVVPTPMAWRRDVIPTGELVFSATIVSSSGIIIEVPVDRLQHPGSTLVRDRNGKKPYELDRL